MLSPKTSSITHMFEKVTILPDSRLRHPHLGSGGVITRRPQKMSSNTSITNEKSITKMKKLGGRGR